MSIFPGVSNIKILELKKAVPGELKAIASARLYSGNKKFDTWEYICVGCLMLVIDKSTGASVLSIVDFSTKQLIWQQEMYNGIVLKKLTKFFIAFEGGDSEMFGISFSKESDATNFYNTTVEVIKKTNKKKKSGNSKKSKGIFVKLKKSDIKKAIQPGVVDRGFIPENISKSWKSILEEAGVSDEELYDHEIQRRIMSAVSSFRCQKSGKKKRKRRKKKKKKDCEVPSPPPVDDCDGELKFSGSKSNELKGETSLNDESIDVMKEIKKFQKKKEGEDVKKKVIIDPEKLNDQEKRNLLEIIKNSLQYGSDEEDGEETTDEEDGNEW